jgi:hypothetical protein
MMKKDDTIQNNDCKNCSLFTRGKEKGKSCGCAGGFFVMGFIGAAVYFIQHSHSFWEGAIGILKAIIWPALVAYKVLEFFKL